MASLCRLIFLFFVMVHTAHSFSTNDELFMARLSSNPGSSKTRGNKFALAFMGNQNQQGAAIMHQLALFITTEQENTTFTIQTRFAAVDGMGFTETSPGSGIYSRTEVARKGDFTFINLPSARGGVGPDFSVRTDGQDETVDRTKGLIIETENAAHELTVYVLSDEQVSTDAYMAINCVEFPTVRNGYQYYVFSSDNNINPSFQSRFIVTPCEDNTEIMVAPSVAYTHPAWVMPSIPNTNPNVANERQTTLGRLFNRFDTVMYNALDDFTGTIITSDKPLSVIVGHQCGIPAEVGTCDFLVEQVPPHPTYGYLFFMAPFAVKQSGEIYRIGSVTDGAQVTINCECINETFSTSNRVALQGSGGVYTATVNQGQYVQCRTPENAQTYCCVQSDPMHPVTMMSYTPGHSIDNLSNLPNLPYNPIAGPAMVYIPPVSSYLNSYSLTTANNLTTVFQGFLSYVLPTQIFDNSAEDRNRFTVNGQPSIPESYTPINCSVDGADEVCAYGATRFMGRGNFEIGYENIREGAFWGYAYGYAREASFAYPLAFEMEPVGLAWVVGEDLTILEADTTITVGFLIVRGDRSESTRAFAYTEGGSATPGNDYTAAGVRPDSGVNSNLRFKRDRNTPIRAFTVTILDDDTPEPVEVIQVQVRCENGENCYSPKSFYTITIIDDDQENCTHGDFRKQITGVDKGILIQYCHGGDWHYLCCGGPRWTSTLATVACRQLGYSNEGAKFGPSTDCIDLHNGNLTAFRTIQACNGMESSLLECGGIQPWGFGEPCLCNAVAKIMCQKAGNVTSPADSVSPTTTSQDDNTTTINNIALGAVIGVLVALVAVVLITHVCIALLYMYKKKSAVHQESHQLEDSSTKNESYPLRQQDDPVYDEASSTQPNYSSLGPDMEAESDLGTNGYESIKYGTSGYDHTKHITKPQAKVANPTQRTDSVENDAEQHTDEVVDADKMEEAQKIGDKRNQQNANVQTTSANLTQVRDEKGDDFYDTEEHIYSEVNKPKKEAKENPTEDSEGERGEDY